MAGQRQYLEWHGRQWRVRLKVPAKVRDVIGRGKLTSPLHTADLKEANERKWPVLAQLKAIIQEAERAVGNQDPVEREALLHRLSNAEEGTQYAIELRATQLEQDVGYPGAKAFFDLASGTVTPLEDHTETFAAHRGYRLKSRADFTRVLGWLGDWLRAAKLPVALESVSRKQAGLFIAQSLTRGRSMKKAAAYLAFLRQYWKWLVEKGHLAENPWTGQTLPAQPKAQRGAEPDGGKRPFTDDEVTKLLRGEADPMLADLMRIAALSGMRLEEICQLQVADCEGGLFQVWAGKTENARRTVPTHSGLKDIIARRIAGKQAGDFLIDELPPIADSRETRSDPAAKRFVRYRRDCGVDERPNDKAKSNVDFHSFRRWFIRKARDARLEGATGFDEWTLTWVVGHTDSDRPKSLELSQHGYAGTDPEKAKRALVEAVRLPAVNASNVH